MIDGVEYAGETMVVALGITDDGTKRVLGLRQGATENAAVCTALLEDLQPARPGHHAADAPGARRLEGAARRREAGLGPERRDPAVPGPQEAERQGPRPREALAGAGAAALGGVPGDRLRDGQASLEGTATWLARINPDAAASLREGLEETLTVVKLGVPGALRRSLATTNPIESALSVTRRVTARVTRWRDGDMRKRWCVAGLLRAESKFRRLKGHRAMPTLLKALEAIGPGATDWNRA